MKILIEALEDERAFEAYKLARDLPRLSLANSVYPGCKITLQHYADLEAHLSSDMNEYSEYHAIVTSTVDSHIDAIRDAMQTIVAHVEGIEKAAPGTFGIEAPNDE